MVNLELIDSLRIVIAFLIAYFPTVALAGFAEAWGAKKLGDPTPEQFGFLTLNPMIHTDILGLVLMIVLLFFGQPIISWGRRIPLDPFNIRGKNKNGKIFLLYSIPALAHFVLMIIAVLIFIFLLGGLALKTSLPVLFVQHASMLEAIQLIFKAFLQLNLFLFVVSIFIILLRLLQYHYFDTINSFSYSDLVIFFAPIALMWFFADKLAYAVTILLVLIEYGIVHLIG